MSNSARIDDYGYVIRVSAGEDISWAQSVYLKFINSQGSEILVTATKVDTTTVEYQVPPDKFPAKGVYRMFLIAENDAIPRKLTSDQMSFKVI